MSEEVLVVLDGGGTRTRCLAISRSGLVLGGAESAASNDLQVGAGAALAAVEQALREAIAAGGVPRDRVAAVSAGLAGVDVDGAGGGRWVDAFRAMGFPTAFVHGDMMAAHRGALAHAPGIVAVAGTGSVTVGIGDDGEVVKVGGWGPIYGNEGSAQWIGREGLRAAARAADGRGPSTLLVERLGRGVGV
jgi:N-acetylglucosamine kinase-like BadF-type ATPase